MDGFVNPSIPVCLQATGKHLNSQKALAALYCCEFRCFSFINSFKSPFFIQPTEVGFNGCEFLKPSIPVRLQTTGKYLNSQKALATLYCCEFRCFSFINIFISPSFFQPTEVGFNGCEFLKPSIPVRLQTTGNLKTFYFLKCLAQVLDNISRQHRFLSFFLCGEVTGQPVEVNTKRGCLCR